MVPKIGVPVQSSLPDTFSAVRENLIRQLRAHGLRVGYVGYPPFVIVDEHGSFSGPAVEYARSIAGDLGLDCTFTRLKWDGITEALSDQQVDLVIDPIIQGRNVGLISYALFQSILLIYPASVESQVRRLIDGLSDADERGTLTRHSFLKYIGELELIRDGIAVTAGTVTEMILQRRFHFARIKAYESTDILQNINDALSEGGGRLIIVDEPSWHRAVGKIHPIRRMEGTRLIDWDSPGYMVPAGFAVEKFNHLLQTYLSLENQHGSGRLSEFVRTARGLADQEGIRGIQWLEEDSALEAVGGERLILADEDLPPLTPASLGLKSDTSLWKQAKAASEGPPESELSNEVTKKFAMLTQQWKSATIYESSVYNIATNDFYQQIIGLGAPILPLIFEEMQRSPDHWFWALRALTGNDPVREEHRGNVRQMTEDWFNWGREHGYV